jgi:hypothetical protein
MSSAHAGQWHRLSSPRRDRQGLSCCWAYDGHVATLRGFRDRGLGHFSVPRVRSEVISETGWPLGNLLFSAVLDFGNDGSFSPGQRRNIVRACASSSTTRICAVLMRPCSSPRLIDCWWFCDAANVRYSTLVRLWAAPSSRSPSCQTP